ncbi:MAG: NERD domain-containing protein [Bacillota bacterium]|nr:NERD domain-containing protein [Bacillota bacterium]
MGLIDMLFSVDKKIKSPIFVKDFCKENKQLTDLIELSGKIKDGEKKDFIDQDIVFLRAGIEGESNVYFELKNSFMPMLCLHDIRLEYGDYIAQFDFIIITNKFICILETKRLNGNIAINKDGDFIRMIPNKYGKIYRKEGMYSPISQNDRHCNILKEILLKEKLIRNMPVNSLVVMANPKTIIDKQKCPAYISKALYKYDQIIPYFKRHINDEKNDMDVAEKHMYRIANYLVEHHTPLEYDYYNKYRLTEEDFIDNKESLGVKLKTGIRQVNESGESYQTNTFKEKDKDQLYNELKAYRLQKSKQENLKPYFIYSNAEMEELISKYPTTIEELLNVKGFGKVKAEKYGEDILKIFI